MDKREFNNLNLDRGLKGQKSLQNFYFSFVFYVLFSFNWLWWEVFGMGEHISFVSYSLQVILEWEFFGMGEHISFVSYSLQVILEWEFFGMGEHISFVSYSLQVILD